VFSKKKKDDKGKNADQTLYCSFCGKSQHEVKKLIAGPTVFICNECTVLCMDIITEERKLLSILWGQDKERACDPNHLYSALEDKVPGSERALRGLALLLARHNSNRIEVSDSVDQGRLPMFALLRGAAMARADFTAKLSDLLPLPFFAVDALEAAKTGDAGEICSELALALLSKADFHTERAGHGVVYIDDLESVFRPTDASAGDQAPSIAELHGSLMQFQSGEEVVLHSHHGLRLDTRCVTFVLGGRFPRLDGVPAAPWADMAKAEGPVPPPLTEAQSEALLDSGLWPDLVARVTTLIDLEEEAGDT